MTKQDISDRSDTASSRALLAWVWNGYLRKHVKILLIAVFFMTLEGSMLGALSYMMQPMFDQVFMAGNGQALWVVGLVIMGIFCVRAFSSVVQKGLLAHVSQRSAAALRIDLLDRLMLQDGNFHQTHPPGYLIQRVQSDVNAINAVWSAVITGAGRDFMALLVLLGVAISVDPVWALVAMIGTPLLILPASVVQRFVRKQARSARDLGATLSTRLDEVFHGIVPVKLNALETYQSRRFRALTDTFAKTEVRAALGAATLSGMVDVVAGIGFFAVLLFAGSDIIAGEKTVGQFMTFFTAMGFAFDPLRRLAAISGVWQMAAAAIERLRALMDAPIRLTSPETPIALPQGVPTVTLDNVSLSYHGTDVLQGLSFEAQAGKTTALVGASGAGKSTVFNLLTRLIDPGGGQVLIGGAPTTALDLADLRGVFSVVTQEALLFDDTIRESIVLGRTDVDEAQLQEVLDAAHVSDFVASLPDGLETEVGPRGSALSGGQRQRVVIARALLRDTPVLLLDEATSALDAQSEKVVQSALDRLAHGRTTLVIAHRLSTIRGAAKIIVMDRGRAVDEGTHEDLLARGGLYADLYRLQFQDGKAVVDVEAAELVATSPNVASSRRSGILGRLASWLR